MGVVFPHNLGVSEMTIVTPGAETSGTIYSLFSSTTLLAVL
jgi:hypothetical protein